MPISDTHSSQKAVYALVSFGETRLVVLSSSPFESEIRVCELFYAY